MPRLFKQQYTAKQDGGRTVTKQSRKWYCENPDPDGKPRRVALSTDKAAAHALAVELERAAERKRAGIIDRNIDHLKRPLSEHVTDWHKALLAKGATAKHADLSLQRVRRVLAACRAAQWSDLTASRIQATLAELRRLIPKGDRTQDSADPASIESRNHHLRAVKGFCRWMVRDGRMTESPVAHLAVANARTDRRHDRRDLSADELRGLIAAAQDGPARFGMTGPERALCYRLAAESGLRVSELRSLSVASFDLGEQSTVTVAAGYSKRRREDVQPIRPELAADLWTFLAGRDSDSRAFNVPPSYDTARLIRADLADAGIPYADDAGRVADFHSLRHTFISNLARGECIRSWRRRSRGIRPSRSRWIGTRTRSWGTTRTRWTHCPTFAHRPGPENAAAGNRHAWRGIR